MTQPSARAAIVEIISRFDLIADQEAKHNLKECSR